MLPRSSLICGINHTLKDVLIMAMSFRSRFTTGDCTLHVPSTQLSDLSHPRLQLEPFPPTMHSIVSVPLFPPSHRLIQSALRRCLETRATPLLTAWWSMASRGSLSSCHANGPGILLGVSTGRTKH